MRQASLAVDRIGLDRDLQILVLPTATASHKLCARIRSGWLVPTTMGTGPGERQARPDLGLFKNIGSEHGTIFQLRGEATNIFNLVSLSNPTANLASSNYGKIASATGTQRVIQVGGRLTF